MRHLLLVTGFLAAGLAPAGAGHRAAAALSIDGVNAAPFAALPNRPGRKPSPEIVKAEILLDRARFSPGSIDGLDGDNFRKALAAYRTQLGLPAGGPLDEPTWARLTADTGPALVRYRITDADAKGPFTTRIPRDFEAQGDLDQLGYKDIRELFGERFHASPALLKALNPRGDFAVGSEIVVPAVEAPPRDLKATRIVVDKAGRAVEAFGADGKLLAFFPATIGSAEKPAPTGTFAIRRIVHHPDYTYQPKYGFKGVGATKPFRIAPGPNNPVGAVWMDLSYEGYGIHGTPDPETVGKAESHGCVRLTNWDAERLAAMVDKNVAVLFEDAPGQDGPGTAGVTAADGVPPAPAAAASAGAAKAAPANKQ